MFGLTCLRLGPRFRGTKWSGLVRISLVIPPDIKKCFEPEAGILIIKEFKGVSKSHDFMTGILPTLVSDLTFISSFFSFGSEDTSFDPGIVTFLELVAFSMAVSCS
ncbi:hypothetical protein Tco_0511175, partial [Tanacetum coccineum]